MKVATIVESVSLTPTEKDYINELAMYEDKELKDVYLECKKRGLNPTAILKEALRKK